LSDIQFVVEEETIYAHKAIITSRCDVLAAMFSGPFIESRQKQVKIGECSTESFLAFLEYIYTGITSLSLSFSISYVLDLLL
jgi:hypothetical protein